ncbi:MAG: iron hydrogenase small subunit, partial [Peptostreptococcus porci]|nr:iron hydrogenase small subunit [Peptostreptococcus porci]
LGNARKLMDSIIKGDVKYDFVEVMACPGGCSGGGGQPIREGMELASARGEKLYDIDRSMYLRYSHENPSIKKLYDDYLEKPSSHLAHKLLHTDHESWDTPLSPLITMVQDENFFDEY